MNIKGKSVMVTGGAGFIGSHLVDRLIKEEPERIDVVDNLFLGKKTNLDEALEKCEFIHLHKTDAADETKMKKILEESGTDVVFNLAVIPLPTCLEKPGWTVLENMRITTSVCELQRAELFRTLIHYSSSEAYGSAVTTSMDETHPLNPTTPYAASKAATDHLVLSYYKTFGNECSIVRPFNNYGPRQNEKTYAGVFPLTIRRILRGENPIIYGTGEQTRDYLYVTDTVDATIKICNTQKTRGRVLNIASGKEISINELIKLIAEEMNCDKEIVYKGERAGDVFRHQGNIDLAKKLIDFKPAVDLNKGIKQTIEWYTQSKGD